MNVTFQRRLNSFKKLELFKDIVGLSAIFGIIFFLFWIPNIILRVM